MSKGIAVNNLDKAGGIQLPILDKQTFWHVEGELVAVKGDLVKPHGPHIVIPGIPMVEGSAWMFLNGIPVCHEGHKAACKHVTTGRPWWKIS